MKACRHLARFDIEGVTGVAPALVVCSECVSTIIRALNLNLDVMRDAQDNTLPVHKLSLRRLLYDLGGRMLSRTIRS